MSVLVRWYKRQAQSTGAARRGDSAAASNDPAANADGSSHAYVITWLVLAHASSAHEDDNPVSSSCGSDGETRNR